MVNVDIFNVYLIANFSGSNTTSDIAHINDGLHCFKYHGQL